MSPPDERSVLQQALRGTGFVIAIAAGIILGAAAVAVVFAVVMT